MKKVSLKKLTIANFKGIKNLEIDFKEQTDVFGANETGKSSTFDAFLWLLFGKNSEDKKDFSIKNTVDKSLNRQEHEVSAVLEIDGEENTLKRIYKEKWVKKRGEEVAEYNGNETLYYWNDVPMQQKDFQSKVSNVLEESVFKLITNPLAFNSLKWQDRRSFLLQIAGEQTDEELARGNSEYEKLVANLTHGKTMADYKKQIDASVKKAKDDLKAIPTRIDEVSRSKPEALDFESLRSDLSAKENEVKAIDGQIQDKSAAFDAKLQEINAKKLKANSIRGEISTMEIEARREAQRQIAPDTSELDGLVKKLDGKEIELKEYINALQSLSDKHANFEKEIASLDERITAKRSEWTAENAKEIVFQNDSFCCPTCKRDFDESDAEAKRSELASNFKAEKSRKLNEINSQGASLAKEKKDAEESLASLKTRIENGQEIVKNLGEEIKAVVADIETLNAKSDDSEPVSEELLYESILSLNPQYKEKKAELAHAESQIEVAPKVDIEELQQKRRGLLSEIDAVKSKLGIEAQIKSADDRIKQLTEEEKRLAHQVADVEKTQFAIERFEKHKMSALEEKVNSRFQMVKFRMFEEQVNGGETPACEIMVNGVPFSDANTASRINAGIDIINVLCDFYQVNAPIFIDNRESVTKLIASESQIISLIVSPEDKVLRIA